MTLVFKGVRERNGRYFSSSAAHENTRVEYKIGEWSFSLPLFSTRGFGLFTFDTMEHLERFSKSLNVLLCEGQSPMPHKNLIHTYPEDVEYKGCYKDLMSRPPDGTLMFGAVRPIVEVTNAEVCYKLVNKDGSSLFVDTTAALRYEIGKPTKAVSFMARIGMHPTTFETIEDTKQFLTNKYERKLYKCLGINRQQLPNTVPNDSWANGMCVERREVAWYWPDGTAMYEKVVPIEEVEL